MQRLILRQPLPSDLEAVVRIHCDPRTNQFNPSAPPTPQQASEMLASWIAHWQQYGFGYWAVAQLSTPEHVIGFGGVMRKEVGHLYGLSTYFRFAPEALRHGFATELANDALGLAFYTLCAPKVLGLVRPANLASRHTLERVGLAQFATTDDVEGQEPSLLYRARPSAA